LSRCVPSRPWLAGRTSEGRQPVGFRSVRKHPADREVRRRAIGGNAGLRAEAEKSTPARARVLALLAVIVGLRCGSGRGVPNINRYCRGCFLASHRTPFQTSCSSGYMILNAAIEPWLPVLKFCARQHQYPWSWRACPEWYRRSLTYLV